MSAEETSRSSPDDGGRSEGALGGASERIRVVLEAAEKAAAAILEEADEKAAEELDAARRRADELTLERVRMMSRLTDDLLEQAASVRRKSGALVETLDAAIAQLEGARETPRAPEAAQRSPAPTREEAVSRAFDPPATPEAVAARKPAPEASAPPAEPAAAVPAAEEPVGEEPVVEEPAVEQPAVEQPRAEEQPPADEPAPTASPRHSVSMPATEPPPDRFEALRARISGAIRSAGTTPPAPTPPRRPAKPPQRRKPLGEGVSEGARLLATQMAFAGSGREEIETRLRDEFGIEHAGPIVDGVIES